MNVQCPPTGRYLPKHRMEGDIIIIPRISAGHVSNQASRGKGWGLDWAPWTSPPFQFPDHLSSSDRHQKDNPENDSPQEIEWNRDISKVQRQSALDYVHCTYLSRSYPIFTIPVLDSQPAGQQRLGVSL